MRQQILLIIIVLASFDLSACSCSQPWNDSFSLTAERAKLVALVKVISFDEYLDNDVIGYDKSMPYSMTVEIIKKYRGIESRKRIRILGDNGMLCRPYLDTFEINSYYLVAPNSLSNSLDTKYEFFVCNTTFLEVDIESNIAYGNYSMIRSEINLDTFESKLKNGDWDLVLIVLIGCLIILVIIVFRKKKKRFANKKT